MTDISNAFDFLMNLFWYGIFYCFNLLDSITFYDVSLLSFIITITIIGALLPIIISFVKSSGSSRGSSKRSKSE